MNSSWLLSVVVALGLFTILGLVVFFFCRQAIESMIDTRIKLKLSRWDSNSLHGLHLRICAVEKAVGDKLEKK